MGKKRNNTYFWVIKSIMLITLFITIISRVVPITFTRELGKGNIQFDMEFLDIEWHYWLYGYVIAFLVAYVLHLIVYIVVKASKSSEKVKNNELKGNFGFVTLFWFVSDKEQYSKDTSVLIGFLKAFFLKLFSPDYSFASTFKAMLLQDKLDPKCPRRKGSPHQDKKSKKHIQCEDEKGVYNCEIYHQKNRRKDFVIYSNWSNVIIACLLCIIVIITGMKETLFTFLVFHMLSRIIEVVFAFYKDVVRAKMNSSDLSIGYKSSNLKRGHRISLALHSYVEFILLFACIYFLSGKYINVNLTESNMSSFLDFLLYSMSVSAYNFSLDLGATPYGKAVHVTQVFTSMTLIVLSIATYIGMKDEMSSYETMEWLEEDDENIKEK